MQINIHFTMTDVQQQAGLLLAYMQVLQIQDDAEAVDLILKRRRRTCARRDNTIHSLEAP